MSETIDLSPDWDALAEFFDQKAKDARTEQNNTAHTIWTQLAEKAANEDLTKTQVFHWAGVEEITATDEAYLPDDIDGVSDDVA